MSNTRDDDLPSGRRIAIWAIGAVVLLILVGIGTWAFRVATSETKGKGDAVIAQNEGTNQNNQRQVFYDLYNGIQASDDNIQVLATAAAGQSPTSKAVTDLNGTILICNSTVAKYNSMVTAPLSAKWKPEELPDALGGGDPSTDCQPDNPPSAAPVPAASR